MIILILKTLSHIHAQIFDLKFCLSFATEKILFDMAATYNEFPTTLYSWLGVNAHHYNSSYVFLKFNFSQFNPFIFSSLLFSEAFIFIYCFLFIILVFFSTISWIISLGKYNSNNSIILSCFP